MTFSDQTPRTSGDATPMSAGGDGERRARAVIADAQSETQVDLRRIWAALTSSQFRAVDHFSTQRRCYLLVTRTGPVHGPRLTPHRLEVLERVLLGYQQKAIASDFNVSPSTIAALTSEALHALGLRCGGSQAPLALAVLVHAHRQQGNVRFGRSSELTLSGTTYQVVSIPDPHESLASKVSPAEGAVLRLRLDGKSHAEIAKHRKSSARTVANQLASASRKLGISGRSELLRYLAGVCA